jgi:hypothetical protein
MRIVHRLRSLEVLTGMAEGVYDINYDYDAQGRIATETITGDISRTTTFSYDADDNIQTEVIEENGKVITKTYSYDPVTKNVAKVSVVVTNE